jgi:hypothetical protein
VSHGDTANGMPRRVLGIGSVIALMVAAILALAPGVFPGRAGHPDPAAGPLVAPGAPIRGESDVFRLRPGDLAASPDAERRQEANPRTMAT